MKKININEAIWFGILIGFSYYIYNLLMTAEILYFVHPRMIKFVIAALLVFILLTIFQVKKLTRRSNSSKIKIGYIMFILPLLIGTTIAPQGLNEEVALKRGISVANTQSNNTSLFRKTIDESKGFRTEEILDITPDIFDGALSHMKNSVDDYVGQRVRISGFIEKQDTYPTSTFVVARMLMVCCAADTLVKGLLAEWEGIDDFEKFQWVEIEGIIEKTEFYDDWLGQSYVAPIIKVDTIKEIERPTELYVYPSKYIGQ
ncbi:TIGR03943 family putative permease subunit [Alkaliphilus peptidifermentans]|uniref:Putative membrane protein n=1 Tax=Alkaliphilus peptidifermentans DSM 18978 TaxID=1120976 RepID=A0A1G5FZ00_9FIRM|nr:TIGR03943 family protein [Alkaliphilus peptidifermentans]SCY44349.1 putative membrane protein [Alkaliphilus peptidifermentans DSM 18978]